MQPGHQPATILTPLFHPLKISVDGIDSAWPFNTKKASHPFADGSVLSRHDPSLHNRCVPWHILEVKDDINEFQMAHTTFYWAVNLKQTPY